MQRAAALPDAALAALLAPTPVAPLLAALAALHKVRALCCRTWGHRPPAARRQPTSAKRRTYRPAGLRCACRGVFRATVLTACARRRRPARPAGSPARCALKSRCVRRCVRLPHACSLLRPRAHAYSCRAQLVACLLLHEWAHAAAGAAASLLLGLHGTSARAALSARNLRGNVPLAAWAACLLPAVCGCRGGPKHSPYVLWAAPPAAGARAAAAARAAVRLAGPAVSLAVALAAQAAAAAAPRSACAAAAAAAAWLVLLCAAASDLLAWHPCRFGCGNFGLLINLRDRRTRACADHAPYILERMCSVTQVRGAQAAGVVALLGALPREEWVEDSRHGADVEQGRCTGYAPASAPPALLRAARRRLVNSKRGDMPAALRAALLREAGGAYPAGASCAAFAGHTRFATASLPAVRETHPHQWCPPARCRVWAFRAGAFRPQEDAPTGCMLTHNGDLDAVRLFRREVGTTELGLWLARVLHCANDAAADSPKAAGMCDLLLCAGRWDAAVRWAYQAEVARAATDASGGAPLSHAAPNTAPTPAWAAAWAALLDAATAAHSALLAHPLAPGGPRCVVGSVVRFVDAVLERVAELPAPQAAALGVHPDCLHAGAPATLLLPALRDAAAAAGVMELMDPLTLRKFLRRAALAFTTQDGAEALRLLLSRASGSFGLVLVSSTEPDTVAVAAWGQQMSVGLHAEAGVALFASEAAAMKVPIKDGHFMTHRLDLEEGRGEVLRVSLRPRSVTRNEACGRAMRGGAGGGASVDRSFAAEHSFKGGSLFGFTWQGISVTSFRFDTQRESTPSELERRLVPLLDNPLVQPLPLLSGAAQRDPVGADIEAIPAVLARVRQEWQHADSLCRQSATAFARILLEKMAINAAPGGAACAHDGRDADVLVVGCESSLWIAQQWAADLQRALPRVAARALSANKVLALLGAPGDAAVPGFPGMARSQLPLRNALVLLVSQSGQTFPVLHAARLLRHAIGDRVFVLTGEFDTKLGLVVGQDMARQQPFCARIFSNFAGWRPAEPTTVAAAAAHATLTELLLFLLHAYTLELPPPQAAALLGLAMPRDDVRCLAELRDASTLQAVPEICLRADGTSVVGLSFRETATRLMFNWTAGRLPGVHERLVAQGQEWAVRVTEGWRATVFSALYVFGTIWFQFAPMNVVSVVVGCGQPFYFVCQQDAKCCVIGFALRLVDVALYIWVGWLFLLARRRLAGADVFARRGRRTLIVADVPWVHQCVEVYVSKLFALSYGDNGLDVHGASPTDSFVHRFTHRVHRGVLIALGRADGRVSSLARAEGAALLAAMQAAAIHSAGCGPEIVSVGHNTWHGNPGAIREHVVLPTHRRRFMCEYVFDAVAGRAGGASDPQSVLASLGRGVVVPAEALAMSSAARRACDRCAAAAPRRECLQCAARFCAACAAAVHGRAATRGHLHLGVNATHAMRRAACAARRRVLARAGITAEEDEAESPDSKGAAIIADVARFGGGAGHAFPEFGARAAAVMLRGHGRLLRVGGAPLGLHYAKRLLSRCAPERARTRWRFAIAAVLARRNPWKRLLLHLVACAAVSADKPTALFPALNSMMEEVDVRSQAVVALETPMKDLYEGRFASLERYIAWLVLFHAMALRASKSSWPLPPWDISRSQSILRVSSTAAPVSGAEVAAQLAGEAAPTAFVTRRRRLSFAVPRVASRDSLEGSAGVTRASSQASLLRDAA
jgi:hypothetical protein